jgi:hypothetical protein
MSVASSLEGGVGGTRSKKANKKKKKKKSASFVLPFGVTLQANPRYLQSSVILHCQLIRHKMSPKVVLDCFG